MIVDAHLDLSMNAMEWNRDLRLSIQAINEREVGMVDKPDRAKATVCFEEMRKGDIGLCVATQIARYVKPNSVLPGWASQAQAWAQTQAQLAWYQAMEAAGELRQIRNLAALKSHLNAWQSGDKSAIAYILSLEGADSIIDLSYLEKAFEDGLRALGPAHYGPGVYAFGTDAEGDMPTKGLDLLAKMDELGMILDLTHLSDKCFWKALEVYKGPLWASHHLCRAITPHNRQLSDDMIKALIERETVIGMAFDAWMIVPNWIRGKSTPQTANVSIESVLNHVDHICQIAGSASHVGIGSDLDGAFGREQCPQDLATIADLAKIPAKLSARGYSVDDIEKIMGKNWLNYLEKAWAE